MAAFPPPKDQIASYQHLLATALASGADPLAEDTRGRNCIFVICEAMSHTLFEAFPESRSILLSLLEKCGSSGLGNADRSGKTVFDLEEGVTGSCLSSCRKILLSSTSHSSEKNFTESIRADAKWNVKPAALSAARRERYVSGGGKLSASIDDERLFDKASSFNISNRKHISTSINTDENSLTGSLSSINSNLHKGF